MSPQGRVVAFGVGSNGFAIRRMTPSYSETASRWPAIYSALELRAMSGAGGGTWTLTDLAVQRIFIPGYGFRRLRHCVARFGVWTIPSPCPDLAPGVRCCPS